MGPRRCESPAGCLYLPLLPPSSQQQTRAEYVLCAGHYSRASRELSHSILMPIPGGGSLIISPISEQRIEAQHMPKVRAEPGLEGSRACAPLPPHPLTLPLPLAVPPQSTKTQSTARGGCSMPAAQPAGLPLGFTVWGKSAKRLPYPEASPQLASPEILKANEGTISSGTC